MLHRALTDSIMGQKRKSEFNESQPFKKSKFTKTAKLSTSLNNAAAKSEQQSDVADRHFVALKAEKGKKLTVKTQDLLNNKEHNKKCNKSDLKSVSKTVLRKNKKPLDDVKSDTVKEKLSGLKDLCKRNDEKLPLEKPSFEAIIWPSSRNKFSRRSPAGRPEVSCNWKQLVKSGTIKYNGKKTTQKKPLEKETKTKTSDIWFDGVDELLIENGNIEDPASHGRPKNNPLVKADAFDGLTKILAMDCEMVGGGLDGKDNLLARVSIVNHFGQCLYDKYVKPAEKVKDYRTFVSGIRPSDIENGEDFKIVQKEVCDMLNGRILVGHAIYNDLKVLFLDHPNKKIRDTSRYKPFRALFSGGIPSLKKLSEKLLGVKIQDGEHNSVQDAQAAMRLYTMHRKKWERSLKKLKSKKNP